MNEEEDNVRYVFQLLFPSCELFISYLEMIIPSKFVTVLYSSWRFLVSEHIKVDRRD